MSTQKKLFLMVSTIGFAAAAQAAPDLTADWIRIDGQQASFSGQMKLDSPSAPGSECRYHYSVNITNKGADSASAPFKVYLRSPAGAQGTASYDLDYQMIDEALASGQAHLIQDGEIVLYGGNRTISVSVDDDKQIAEGDENNNRRTQSVRVPLDCGPEPTEHWVTCPSTNPPVNAPSTQECPKDAPQGTGPVTCWDKSTAASIDQCPTVTCLKDGKTVHDPKQECPQVTCPNGHGAGKYTYSIDAECPAIVRCDGDAEGKRVADYTECKTWVLCGGPSFYSEENYKHSWQECPDYSCPNSGVKVKDARTCPRFRCPNGGEWKANSSECPSATPKPTPQVLTPSMRRPSERQMPGAPPWR